MISGSHSSLTSMHNVEINQPSLGNNILGNHVLDEIFRISKCEETCLYGPRVTVKEKLM